MEMNLTAAWADLSPEEQIAIGGADTVMQTISLKLAATVAHTLRREDVESRPICARKAERDVLEMASKELKLLVFKTGDSPHAMDGQIPMAIETGRGAIGIEVKSGLSTVGTEEVCKFREDLLLRNFVVGVFVSLRAPIAKIPRGMHVQRELSLMGSVPCIFVSPPGGDAMQHLTRGALTLACTLAEDAPQRREISQASNAMTHEHRKDLEKIGRVVTDEIAALGLTRKRFRDEEELFHKRVERATEALGATQQRLGATVANFHNTS